MNPIEIIYDHSGRELFKIAFSDKNKLKKAYYKNQLILDIEYSKAWKILSYWDALGNWHDTNINDECYFTGKETVSYYRNKANKILDGEQEMLTNFGNYLLSPDRQASEKNKHNVTNADYFNWVQRFKK